ncbi:hypothetical protein Ahy_B09g099163 [Arachis hypogaea]|uniref:Uncharacterized protein n=1 Tax=Arachis hypogaea TaxID=3818 RepID=A0A444XT83_ARAHY|nr:hypothetical protein Ahy_B09g099163 [Arachis hypogaea]
MGIYGDGNSFPTLLFRLVKCFPVLALSPSRVPIYFPLWERQIPRTFYPQKIEYVCQNYQDVKCSSTTLAKSLARLVLSYTPDTSPCQLTWSGLTVTFNVEVNGMMCLVNCDVSPPGQFGLHPSWTKRHRIGSWGETTSFRGGQIHPHQGRVTKRCHSNMGDQFKIRLSSSTLAASCGERCLWTGDDARHIFEVQYHVKKVGVHLENNTYTCNMWQLTDIIPEEYVHQSLTIDAFRTTYVHSTSLANSEEYWEKSGQVSSIPPRLSSQLRHNAVEDGPDRTKAKKRFRVTCAKCGEIEHNSKTCKGAPKQGSSSKG